MVPTNSLLMSCRAPIGLLTITKNPVCTNQGILSLEFKKEQVDVLYIYYKMKIMLPMIKAFSSGATFPEISRKNLGKISILLPSIQEQRLNSGILRALDALIEENEAISKLIQQKLVTLFRSWFIDFDPVKEKAKGKSPYGMNKETAELFPGTFEDSEHGLLPKGWTWGTLLDISKIWTGGTPKTSESSYWGGDIPWVSGADLSSSELFAFDSERKITSLGVNKSSTKVLPVGTVMITARGTVGATKITAVPMAMSQTSFGFKAKKGISDALVYQASQETIRQLRSFAYGAVFDTFTQSTIDITKIAIAPLEILQAFGKIVDPLFETMKNSAKEIIELSSTRDALLPRLMSGELKVN